MAQRHIQTGRKEIAIKIMDLIIEELNKNLTDEQKENGEKFEPLHSEQYQIVQTENGIFRNPINRP